MARTLTELEAGVKFHAGDNQLSLTTTEGLSLANRVYRRLAISLEWPEFYTKDSTLVTVAGQSEYTWPSGSPDSVMSVEVEAAHNDGATFGQGIFGQDLFGPGNTYFRQITQPPSERSWNDAAKNDATDWVWFYRRTRTSGVDKIELRPAPLNSGKTIRITGMLAPTPFSSGTDSTIFINDSADDALERLIAADYSHREGFYDIAAGKRAEASHLLSQLFNRQVEVQ